MTKFKGPVFESWKNPPRPSSTKTQNSRVLPLGKSWISHTGAKARLRNQRKICFHILRDKDPEVVEAVERIRVRTSSEPHPEQAMLYLLAVAKERADEAGVPINMAIDVLIDSFEELIKEPNDAETTSQDPSGI